MRINDVRLKKDTSYSFPRNLSSKLKICVEFRLFSSKLEFDIPKDKTVSRDDIFTR